MVIDSFWLLWGGYGLACAFLVCVLVSQIHFPRYQPPPPTRDDRWKYARGKRRG